jgi:signal transduction histidine kinase
MEQFAVWFLFSLNVLMGVAPIPKDFRADWKITRDWEKDGPGYSLHASSEKLAALCAGDPTGAIQFPRVIHSAHRISVNSHVIYQQGDFDFEKASPFYEQPVISCSFFPNGSTVDWEVSSYSQYFARFGESPKLIDGHSFRNTLNVDANFVSSGVLIVLSILSLFLFSGRIPKALLGSICLGSFVSAGYFLNCANSRLGLPLSMLESHKLADLCTWTAAYFFFFGFYVEGLIAKWVIGVFGASVLLANVVIVFGTSGTQVQVGTMIPMGPYLLISVMSAISLLRDVRKLKLDPQHYLRLLSLLSFLLAGISDLSIIAGLREGNLCLSIGIVGAFFGMAVAVNRDIDRTYQERDSLLTDLEKKVTEKTHHLSEALTSLKTTQAELIQSAKLASLGTLSAGVAHEINNSINYVSGALKPLEKRLKILVPEADQPQITKLLDAIKEGTSLTVGIVQSLRVYTGLNQAKFKEFALLEIVQSARTILKSKARLTEFHVDLAPTARLNGSMVGMSQIVMNLLSNALDAVPAENGQIWITGSEADENVTLSIRDNGTGIPKHVLDRIYEPFYTTKEVGKGTGLGMHIVLKEVERHHGKIEIVTAENQGTEFRLTFPKMLEEMREAA